jgi:hypothetical protein
MHPDFEGYDLEKAADQLLLNIEETRGSGFHRSLVAALSLMGLVALAQKQFDVAKDYSTQAVTYVKKMRDLPALRTEEIFFNHYKILTAFNRLDEAKIYLHQAHQTLHRKAETITDLSQRTSFLKRVTLSQEISNAIKIE